MTVFAASLFGATLAAFAWQEPQLRHAIAFQVRPEQLASLPSTAVLVPARHEEAVLATTLERLATQPYPGKLDIVAIVSHDDPSTHAIATLVAEARPE